MDDNVQFCDDGSIYFANGFYEGLYLHEKHHKKLSCFE